MKKALIVTVYDPYPNYGNKLQNYASKRILEKLGLEVSTLVTEPQPSMYKLYLKYILNGILKYRLRDRNTHVVWEKMIKFNAFNKKYLNPDTSYIDKKFNAANYDFFALGSDQVWNPSWYDNYEAKKDLFLLTFAEPDQMICMAPSFGLESLPEKWEAWFTEKLSRISHPAVREKSGAKLFKKCTGREAFQVIDPTLMLSKTDWGLMVRKPKSINTEDKYILTYFLGTPSSHTEKYIEGISESTGFKVLRTNDMRNIELFSADPEEFLYLIKNAELVLTDSFHACVFSFIFEKPFEVFERSIEVGSMMSRISTLLELLSLERKSFTNRDINDLFECDYSKGKQSLEIEKEKFSFYIRECISEQ